MAAADLPATPRYQRYRAPREDNQSLIAPKSDQLLRLIASNREELAATRLDLRGRSLADLRSAGRQRLVELAAAYTSAFCDLPADATQVNDATPLIASGHQPDLFHPGVWFKNRVLDRLAEQTGGVGVHLMIDSDQCTTTSLRVPRGPIDQPGWETVAYDQAIDPRPHEERSVVDAVQFASFPDRVRHALTDLIDQPLLTTLWPAVQAAAASGAKLGEALSRGRRLVEQGWGATTLELPFSQLCDTHEMQWGMALALADAPRAREAYNAALADYRSAHRLRSPAQPLPDLARDSEAVETPLWVWTEADPIRRSLFIEQTPAGYRLLDRRGGEWAIAAQHDGPMDDLVEQLAALRAAGVKLRPRALLTTLLGRLLLSDLFLHGIGGAKYDQVTDEWARRWLGLAPPPHATVTATLRLPIDHPSASESQATRLRVRLRELEFHPERFLAGDTREAEPWVQKKQAAIALTDTDRSERHRQIVVANEAIQRLVADRREETQAELQSLRQQLRAAAVLESREYSLCLFPEEDLRRRFDLLLNDAFGSR